MNSKKYSFLIAVVGILLTGCSNDDVAQRSNASEDGVIKLIEISNEEKATISYYNKFAWKLWQQVISENPQENSIISPLSVSLAIGMLANGATEEAVDEIIEVLGLEGGWVERLNSVNAKLVAGLEQVDSNVKLSLANSFWYKSTTIKPYDSFVGALNDYYQAESIGFDGLPATQINSWVSDKTNGLINKIVDDSYNSEVSLINAAYFKGLWSNNHKFDSKNTKKDTFHDYAGTTSNGRFMQNTAVYYYSKSATSCHLALAMGSESTPNKETFLFHILLPAESSLFQQSISEVISSNTSSPNVLRNIALRIPKFEATFKDNIVNDLRQVGLKKTLTLACDGIAEDPLLLNGVIHGATMKVDEDGSEASAATVVTMYTSTGSANDTEVMPLEITLDKPFVYYITERSTGAILFIGHVAHL